MKSDGGTRPPPASGPQNRFLLRARTSSTHAHTHQILIITRASPNHPTQRVPGPGFVNGGLSRTEFKRACKLRLRQATAALGADHTGHLTFWTCESAGAGWRVHSPTAGWGVDWRVFKCRWRLDALQPESTPVSTRGESPPACRLCPLSLSPRPLAPLKRPQAAHCATHAVSRAHMHAHKESLGRLYSIRPRMLYSGWRLDALQPESSAAAATPCPQAAAAALQTTLK